MGPLALLFSRRPDQVPQREAETSVKVGAAASEAVPQWSKSLLLPGVEFYVISSFLVFL